MSDAVFSGLWLAVVGLSAIGLVGALVVLAWKAWFGAPDVDPEAFARAQGATYARASGRGWTITGPAQAWALSFHDAVSVNPELDNGGETRWSAAADLPPGQAVFVSAQPPAWLRGEAVFGVLKALARLGGEPLGQLAAKTMTVSTGDVAFDAAFGVAATDEALARRCLDAATRQHLQAFLASTGRAPQLVWAPGELSLRLSREVTDEAVLKAMIELGRSLAGAPACPREPR